MENDIIYIDCTPNNFSYNKLKRRTLNELLNRYEDYVSNSETPDIFSFKQFVNLDENSDLVIEENCVSDDLKILSTKIVDVFEEVLSEHDMYVPIDEDEDCEDDNRACIYGSKYCDMLDTVTELIYHEME